MGIVALVFIFRKKKLKRASSEFPPKWRDLLGSEVQFYKDLSLEEKKIFESRIQTFLMNKRITGIETNVSDLDRLLVACGAIIPLFWVGEYYYPKLYEVLIYPEQFRKDYALEGEDRNILGLVAGHGIMNGTMILSQKALRTGFQNAKDGKNVAIHEFVHLIDGADKSIDGLPNVLIKHQYAIPFMKIVKAEMDFINRGKSDIDPYGGTSDAEFFAVASELFFENPRKLEKQHPNLYKMLQIVFKVPENY
ncbi:MAG: zinc-dependent peptidase [Crocinitomicaceae bacterium]